MPQPVSNVTSQPTLLSNLSRLSHGSSGGSPSRLNQQTSNHSRSNPSQQSSNAGMPSSPSQHPRRPAPPPPQQQSSALGASGNQNPQLLHPLPSNLSVSITSDTSGSSSTVNTTNTPKPTSPTIPATSQSLTPRANAASAYPAVPRYAFIENTLRAWGLGSLYEAGVKTATRFTTHRRRLFKKREHITLFQHRGIALWASLPHLLPIAATATITNYMNTEYFVGNQLAGKLGTDKFKLLGLQFVAKVHELLMISTLAAVVFAMLRHELVRGDGVPFAFLSAGLGVPRVSYLWSKDFVALCRAKYDTFFKKVLFLGAILLCILLSVTVGPVSAQALTPVRRDWEAGGTKMWLNRNYDALFPKVLEYSVTDATACRLRGRCPSSGWQTIIDGYLPQLNIEVRGKGEAQADTKPQFEVDKEDVYEYTLSYDGSSLRFNIVTLFGHPDPLRAWRSAVTAPHLAVSNALLLNEKLWVRAALEDMRLGSKRHRFTERARSSYKTTTVPIPAASTVCKTLTPRGWQRDQAGYIWPPDLWDEDTSAQINTTEFLRWESTIIPEDGIYDATPQLFWMEVAPNTTKATSIAAFISLELNDELTMFGCNVDARWVYDKLVSTSPRELPMPLNKHWYDEKEWRDANHTKVTISSQWANQTNLNLPSSPTARDKEPSSVFEQMMEAAGVWNRDTFSTSPWAFRLETVLNLMIVNGMARTAPDTYQHGVIHGFEYLSQSKNYNSSRWWEHFMPHGAFGPGGDPYNLTDWPDKNNSFGFQMDMFAEGYGYSFRRSTASRVSIAILLLQLAIASLFIIYTITSGISSSSWESPAELLALAFASEAPEQPADRKGLATGEVSIESLKKLYCVEADGNRLQLKEWTGPRRVEEAKRVKPNTAYN